MRYNPDSNASSLAIENQPQPSVTSIFSQPLLNTTTGYSPETSGFYAPSHLYQGLTDVRPRLGSRLFIPSAHHSSSSTSATGMAHAHRATALPNPGSFSTRDIYSRDTPSFPARTDYTHTHRSPPYATLPRRHPLSPTPSPGIGFTNTSIRMDGSHYSSKVAANIPPLLGVTTLGQLTYATAHTPIKIDIHGTIDKGFFMADGDWTCYRRNYFSCACAYSLTPNYPGAQMQYTPNSSNTVYNVLGFAMSLSAVVADSDSHAIELVQHTPKRDKGPVTQPERMPMSPRLTGTGHLGYETQPYQQTGQYTNEHTFERIQFKQATANNGKRRAAQQYYHLLVELYVNVNEGSNTGMGNDEWIRIAYRKSAKMIVRGRSPGHYQSERRGSSSSGPPPSLGPSGYSSHSTWGGESSGSGLLPSSSYSGQYDNRGGGYGSQRHHAMSIDSMPSDEGKSMERDYQYYSGAYDTPDSSRDCTMRDVAMFGHRSDDGGMISSIPDLRIKHEEGSTLPSLFYPTSTYSSRSCSRFDTRPTTGGYYPAMLQSTT